MLTDSGATRVQPVGPAGHPCGRRRVPVPSRRKRLHLLTPERATEIEAQLGSDIAMALDECLAHPATHEEAAARCGGRFGGPGGATGVKSLREDWSRACRDNPGAGRSSGLSRGHVR